MTERRPIFFPNQTQTDTFSALIVGGNARNTFKYGKMCSVELNFLKYSINYCNLQDSVNITYL